MKVLITAGPTVEAIDDVRFISNKSSGKLGYALAEAAAVEGHEVVLVSGPVALEPPSGAQILNVRSAQDMFEACQDHFESSDLVIFAAAVADYAPEQIEGKRKKSPGPWQLTLHPTVDIAQTLGQKKTTQTLLGFALEAEHALENGKRKLAQKNMDFIFINSPKTLGATEVEGMLIGKDGSETKIDAQSKQDVAKILLAAVL